MLKPVPKGAITERNETMKKTAVKVLSVVLCLALMMSLCISAVNAASDDGDVKGKYTYTITSPYDAVDWDTWQQYKTSVHNHTDASDAEPSIADSIKQHYADGFQILAITDHAVVGKHWNEQPQTVPLYRLFKFENTHMRPTIILTDEERDAIISGTYESEARDAIAAERGIDLGGMMEITGGAEANGATPINDCHINTFGCYDIQAKMGIYGDYETVVKQCDKEGGICFLNHLGEYVGGYPDSLDRIEHPYYANKFANIFLDYDSCVAMEVNSGLTDPTHWDTLLWDEINNLTIPKGRAVNGILSSDGHHVDQYDRAFSMFIMPEKTEEAFYEAMKNGTTFPIARYSGTDINSEFDGSGNMPPEVSRITIDRDTNTISFEGARYDNVRWVSGGKLIAEGADVTSIDLNAYEDELGCYVRFMITGPGGILYSQPFVTLADGVEYTSDVYKTFDMGMVFRWLSDALNITIGWTPVVQLIRGLLWGRFWWL